MFFSVNHNTNPCNPLIYKIKNESKQTIGHLLPSLHVCKQGSIDLLCQKVTKVFEKCTIYAPEFDSIKSSHLEKFQSGSYNILQNKLKEIDIASQQAIYRSYFEVLHARKHFFYFSLRYDLRSEPINVTSSLYTMLSIAPVLTLYDALGEFEAGPDLYFLKEAVSRGKTIADLETVESQLSVLQDNTQIKAYEKTEFDLDVRQTQKIAAAWEQGDLATLDQLMKTPEFQKFAQIDGIRKRDLGMAENIDNILQSSTKDKKLFVSIGVFHCLGEGSVVHLLQKKGWHLEPKNSSR